MESRKIVFKETLIVAVGLLLCSGIMLALYALLGNLTQPVWVGAIGGSALALANFFFMAVGASLAADKAEAQDVAGGQKLLHLSQLLRYVLLAVILFVCIKSDFCDALAPEQPLVFVRPVLTVGVFFRK